MPKLFAIVAMVCLIFIIAAATTAQAAPTSKTQLELRLHKSESVVRFFKNHIWLLATRSERCSDVPWTRSCKIARRVYAHHKARVEKLRRQLDPYLAERQAALAWWESSGAQCVKSKEGGWGSNTGNGYYGGFQADHSFQRAYGYEFYISYGTANNWQPWQQIIMAYRGWKSRGWQPWPNTSRMCGLRY